MATTNDIQFGKDLVDKNYQSSKKRRDKIDKDVEDFLANEGKIQVIETGLSGEDLRAVPCQDSASRYKYVKPRKPITSIKRDENGK